MQIMKYLIAVVLTALAMQAGAQVHQARGQFALSYKDSVGTFSRKEVLRRSSRKPSKKPR